MTAQGADRLLIAQDALAKRDEELPKELFLTDAERDALDESHRQKLLALYSVVGCDFSTNARTYEAKKVSRNRHTPLFSSETTDSLAGWPNIRAVGVAPGAIVEGKITGLNVCAVQINYSTPHQK